jgi:hypothetical protein
MWSFVYFIILLVVSAFLDPFEAFALGVIGGLGGFAFIIKWFGMNVAIYDPKTKVLMDIEDFDEDDIDGLKPETSAD